MKREKCLPLIFLLMFGFSLIGCTTSSSVAKKNLSTIVVKRAGTLMDDGKLYVYVDGKRINEKQPIGKGQSRNLPVSNGFHRIKVRVNNLESDVAQFTVENNSVSFNVSTERVGGSKILLLERGTE